MSKTFERCRKAAASPVRYSYQHGTQAAPAVQRKETEPRSVINPRIDVRAQFALLRLFKGSPDDARDARALFDEVDQGKIKGIFGDDLGVTSRMAAARGTVAWELVPKGQDAVWLEDADPDTPVIVFRASAGKAPRLDQALLAVYRQQGRTGPPQPVTQHGGFTVEGAPETLSSDLPFLPVDAPGMLDTHAHRPQIIWKVKVTQNGPLSQCLTAGFLQTLTENDIRADYAPAGTCTFTPPTVPIRDGFAGTPVWFQLRNARGKGFGSLGTCRIPTPAPLPPIETVDQAVDLALTDDPGGLFPLTHPANSARPLRSIHEALTFHSWLAVKPATAPETQASSYRFLQHLVWTVRRDLDVARFPSGSLGVTFRVNETKIATHENGRGSLTPNLGAATANTATRTCNL